MSLKNEHQNLTIDQILRFSEDTNDEQSREKPEPEDSEEFPLITRHTVSTSPWSRLGIIAIPFGLGFLAIFYFLNGIFNPGKSPEAITAKADKTSSALEKVEQKDGDVYAKLALNKQEDELNKINQSKEEAKINNKPASVAASPSTPTARPVAQTQSPSPRRYYVPSRTNSTISSSPRNQILPRISNPVRTVTPKTETPTDVIAEFNRLRSLGSYGKIAYTPTSNNQQISTEATSFQTPNTTRIQVQPPNSAYTTQQTRPNFSNSTPTEIEKIRPRWSADSKSDKQIADGNYLPQENQILQQRKTRYLVVGEFANGVLVTPVVKQQSENTRFQQQQNPDDSKRYVARLTADLHDNYGNVAIHKGTIFTVEPLQVNGGSYVSVQVTSIIKDNTEYPISSGAISVLGEGGKPLLAKQFQDKKGGGSDLTVGLASGLGQVGTILNQSDSTSSVVNSATGTFSSSTTSNSQRNIGGAFLQGAFGKLSDIIARRAETSNQEITARPDVWYIPQGTKITFLVNRSLELP
ncbi:TrbI/VirB10 family protein [Nostoc sphaeroides]|uniref:Serine/threonine protein kinase n=1 Tax=Nostoc sphaeroides CCNUC1 TaxID=2653204 RepID=A0A5P8WIG1_9NOSO|nr:TrbI/VirB10 family protein [Nostoc sphaeroides]QFS52598.1 serine/threonine protein kinase [Nostoc sphaeroides CCNUC1]